MDGFRAGWAGFGVALALLVGQGCAEGGEGSNPASTGGAGVSGGSAGAAGGGAGAGGEVSGVAGASSAGAGGNGLAGMGGTAGGSGTSGGGGGPGGLGGASGYGGGGGATPEPDRWSGSIGRWCGSGETRTWWLAATAGPSGCEERAPLLTGQTGTDGVSVEISTDPFAAGSNELDVDVRRCSGGDCELLPARLKLQLAGDASTSGTFLIRFDGGEAIEGKLDAGGCDWDAYLPARSEAPPLTSGLRLLEVAAFQTVKIPMMRLFDEITTRTAQIVAGRAALLRVYVVPKPGWFAREVRARLTLVQQGATAGPEVFERTMIVATASTDSELDSTFNFDLSPESLRKGARYSVELLEAEACAAESSEVSEARYPEIDTAPVGVQEAGGLRVHLVPVEYAPSEGEQHLLPDTSSEQVESFRDAVSKLFPVSGVSLTVREQPVVTHSSSMTDLLDEIAALRDEEEPGADVTYYGMARFTETHAEYCSTPCVLGAALIGDPAAASAGVAVGIGFTGSEAVRTFAHELGHVYGREHAPCGVLEADPAYPYREGGLGSWGYDAHNGLLIAPTLYKDFMGYCSPVWISDYGYGALQAFIAAVNEGAAANDGLVASASNLVATSRSGRWRSLILEPGAAPRWGRSRRVSGTPAGIAVEADVLDRDGTRRSPVTVHVFELADAGGLMVYVPDGLDPTWSIRLPKQPPVRVESAFERNADAQRF